MKGWFIPLLFLFSCSEPQPEVCNCLEEKMESKEYLRYSNDLSRMSIHDYTFRLPEPYIQIEISNCRLETDSSISYFFHEYNNPAYVYSCNQDSNKLDLDYVESRAATVSLEYATKICEHPIPETKARVDPQAGRDYHYFEYNNTIWCH